MYFVTFNKDVDFNHFFIVWRGELAYTTPSKVYFFCIFT